jgi:hypothetical protein
MEKGGQGRLSRSMSNDKPTAEERGKCPRCGKEDQEAFLCPFSHEIYDSKDECFCCEDCRRECAWSI